MCNASYGESVDFFRISNLFGWWNWIPTHAVDVLLQRSKTADL